MVVGKNSAAGGGQSAEHEAANAVAAAFANYLRLAAATATSPEMQHLSVALIRLLARGRPVTRDALAEACSLAPERIAQVLGEWPRTAVETDERGAVIGFSGLSLEPTRHRFVTGEAELHTWCAFDALFLPEIIGKPAVLATRCPASGVELTVELAPGALLSARPAHAVLSIVVPDRKAYQDNVRSAFCCHVNLFNDEATFNAWVCRRDLVGWLHGRDRIGCVTLAQAQRLARQRNALRYPDVKKSTLDRGIEANLSTQSSAEGANAHDVSPRA